MGFIEGFSAGVEHRQRQILLGTGDLAKAPHHVFWGQPQVSQVSSTVIHPWMEPWEMVAWMMAPGQPPAKCYRESRYVTSGFRQRNPLVEA